MNIFLFLFLEQIVFYEGLILQKWIIKNKLPASVNKNKNNWNGVEDKEQEYEDREDYW